MSKTEIVVHDKNGNEVRPEDATPQELREELIQLEERFRALGTLISARVNERTALYKELDSHEEKFVELQIEDETTGIDDIDWDDPLACIESDYQFFSDAESCPPEHIGNVEDPRQCLEAMSHFVEILKQNLHRFRFLPKGPLFKEIKVKNKNWAPLVEHVLHPYLFSFLVDNDVDGLVLEEILEEQFPGLKGGLVNRRGVVRPKYHIFKFGNVHEIGSRITAISGLELENMLESVHAEDLDWVKFLSSEVTVEKIVLMENENSAFLAMSSIRQAEHCKMAYTLDGFAVYPFPAFRTVKIKFPRRPLYLKSMPDPEIRELCTKIFKLKEQIKQKDSEIEEQREVQLNLAKTLDTLSKLYSRACQAVKLRKHSNSSKKTRKASRSKYHIKTDSD